MKEDDLIKTEWKNRFDVRCKTCGQEARIDIHLNSDDTDHYFGDIYFKCDNCKSDRVYAANDNDIIFDFGDVAFQISGSQE